MRINVMRSRSDRRTTNRRLGRAEWLRAAFELVRSAWSTDAEAFAARVAAHAPARGESRAVAEVASCRF